MKVYMGKVCTEFVKQSCLKAGKKIEIQSQNPPYEDGRVNEHELHFFDFMPEKHHCKCTSYKTSQNRERMQVVL